MSGRLLGTPRTSWVVGLAIAIAVLARMPLLDLPAWADEGGFLTVGGAWHLGGSTGPGGLYGDLWVDRPPVLITVYGLAERLGGLVTLRLMGALAAAVTIAGVAWIAHAAAGARGARWAAVAAAVLLCSPFHWAFLVDGELLATPAVAVGIALVGSGPVAPGRRALALSCLGGAAAMAAVLTKQNFVDVFVFTTVYLAIRGLSRSLPWSAVLRHAGAFLAGAVGFGAVVAVWTIAHGTSLSGVFYAMYPFRLDATSTLSWGRLGVLGLAAVLSGLALLAVWVTVSGVRRSHRDAFVGALVAVLAFDLFSIVAGGNYWLHYLIEPVVPVAALTGIVVARGSWVRVAVLLWVPLTVVAWVVLVLSPPQTSEETVGRAIGAAAEPGDSVVTLWGHSNVDFAAGMSSPYPYLWVLPARTLDPGAADLKKLLASDRGPSWLVTWRRVPGVQQPGSLGWTIGRNYRMIARICGHTVFVRWDLARREPVPDPRPGATRRSACQSVTELPHVLRELS